MANIEVLLDSDELTVLGPPNQIEVQLDIGSTGIRGSQVYVGNGEPSSITIPNYSSILPGDLYINGFPGVNYSWLYQYVVKPGGNTWESVLAINPPLYRHLYSANFVSGSALATIPISSITSSTAGLTSSNFVVNYNFENDKPVAASITSKNIVSSNLTISFKAVEFSGGSWIDLVDSSIPIALSISIVSV
jgi:hypothetical protein